MENNPNIKHLFDNVDLLKEDGRFYVLMGEEKLQITKEELLLILHDHELVFNVVINAKRIHLQGRVAENARRVIF